MQKQLLFIVLGTFVLGVSVGVGIYAIQHSSADRESQLLSSRDEFSNGSVRSFQYNDLDEDSIKKVHKSSIEVQSTQIQGEHPEGAFPEEAAVFELEVAEQVQTDNSEREIAKQLALTERAYPVEEDYLAMLSEQEIESNRLQLEQHIEKEAKQVPANIYIDIDPHNMHAK